MQQSGWLYRGADLSKMKCTWRTVLGSNLNSACCKANSRKRFAQLQEQIEPSRDIQCMDQWQHLGLRHSAPGRESRLAPSQGGNQDELARLDVVRSTASEDNASRFSLACGGIEQLARLGLSLTAQPPPVSRAARHKRPDSD